MFTEVNGVIRVPHLVHGQLVEPPDVDRAVLDAAFADTDSPSLRMSDCQVIREYTVDTKVPRYLVVPRVDGIELVSWRPDTSLADVPLTEFFDLLERAAEWLVGSELLGRVVEMVRATAPFSDTLLDAELSLALKSMDPSALRDSLDKELSTWDRRGSEYLDGWVDLPGFSLRAMPTRQLHITAGNSPVSPMISMVHGLVTKSRAVVKMPHQAVLPSALLAVALATVDTTNLLRGLSIVYWPGGDELVETPLFAPTAFDRIVVWGDLATVASIRQRTPMTRVISFDPRYGVSLIGGEAFDSAESLRHAAELAADDVLLHDQKACESSHVQYVEGDAIQWAEALRAALSRRDAAAPPIHPDELADQLTRLRRGRLALADWYPNVDDRGRWTSGVVVTTGAMDIIEHPFARFVAIRPTRTLDAALDSLSRHVSTVGIWPESRRLALRTAIAARGVSSILPLGQAGDVVAGAPHDGALVLSQLVDWVRS